MLFRSAPSPSHRLPAAGCLELLDEAFPSVTEASCKTTQSQNSSALVHASSNFDHLVDVIDSFCASGSINVSYDVRLEVLSEVRFQGGWEEGDGNLTVLTLPSGRKNITTAKYDPQTRMWTSPPMKFVRHKEKPWLYVHEGSLRYEGLLGGSQSESDAVARRQRCFDRLQDSIEYPDYFVLPDADITSGFFLPVNKFSNGLQSDESMLDAERLELLRHGNWFTVFQYTPPTSSEVVKAGIIIKRTPINNATFKYLLHERTMLSYLIGSDRIALERLDGGFASLLLWKVNGGKSYQNERFIAYQDGGRPLEVQFFSKDAEAPSPSVLLRIAQDLLQALIFLYDKRVVHRNLNLGTVVYSEAGGAKLIALGSAKYIDRLPYEDRIRHFEEEVCGFASPQKHDGTRVFRGLGTPPPPTTTTNPEDFNHPLKEYVNVSLTLNYVRNHDHSFADIDRRHSSMIGERVI